MRPIAEATFRVTEKNFDRKYIALGRIVKNWNAIVGAEMAAKAQPVKINYRKAKRGEPPEASLDIAATTADATLLHYQKDLILERLNQVFGDRWINAIRFVPAQTSAKPTFAAKHKTLLTGDKKNHLSQLLENVSDPSIKERLEKLGTEILASLKS